MMIFALLSMYQSMAVIYIKTNNEKRTLIRNLDLTIGQILKKKYSVIVMLRPESRTAAVSEMELFVTIVKS